MAAIMTPEMTKIKVLNEKREAIKFDEIALQGILSLAVRSGKSHTGEALLHQNDPRTDRIQPYGQADRIV